MQASDLLHSIPLNTDELVPTTDPPSMHVYSVPTVTITRNKHHLTKMLPDCGNRQIFSKLIWKGHGFKISIHKVDLETEEKYK